MGGRGSGGGGYVAVVVRSGEERIGSERSDIYMDVGHE